MYTIKKIRKLNALELCKVATILNACGKDMAKKYDLHHWDNPYIKSLIIVALCNFKNEVFLIYYNDKPVATFMIKQMGTELHFEKLGTLPTESGKGIGTLCMVKIEELAKASGCKRVCMEVYEPSENAIEFYKHKGYRTAGVTETLKYKEVKMEKEIQ